MITTILSDFSRVILQPVDSHFTGSLNGLNKKLIEEQGQNYNFFNYFELNDPLLRLYADLKKNYPIYIFTTDTIQNRPEVQDKIKGIITGIFSAKDYALDKKDTESYFFIARKLEIEPTAILYIDDQKANTAAAQKAGMETILYESFTQLGSALSNLQLDY